MPEKQTAFPELDRMIHEPARLAILTVLSSSAAADFTFLQTATGLTKGNLFVQLARLEQAGLVHLEKAADARKARTTVELSTLGRRQLGDYWHIMSRIQQQAALRPGKSRRLRKEKPAS
jgi:DNA-binding transcriptional ArsR family regulator